MAQKIQKTNVCRLLDAAGIAYELIGYAVDESDLSAVHVAAELHEDIDAVFKTIVLEGDKVKHFVCVVPGACEVDLKKAARANGNKSCKPIPQKELLPLHRFHESGTTDELHHPRNEPDYHEPHLAYMKKELIIPAALCPAE